MLTWFCDPDLCSMLCMSQWRKSWYMQKLKKSYVLMLMLVQMAGEVHSLKANYAFNSMLILKIVFLNQTDTQTCETGAAGYWLQI